MANRNIQMKKRNDSGGWDNLFPVTLSTNVFNEDGVSVKDELADVVKKVKGIKLKNLPEPLYICHRGAKNIFPESSLEAYRGCISMGLNIIEQDVRRNADGVLVVSHDESMDRTTNRSGLVSNYSTMGFKAATITELQNFDGTPVLLEEILLEFKNNAIYVIETKERNIDKDVVNMILKYNLEENCIIQSFNINDLSYAVQNELPAMYLTDSESPTVIKNAGIDYVGVSTNASDQYIQSCIQEGLKVVVWTVSRRYEHDHYVNLGVSGFFTEDPLWIMRKSPILSVDPFREQVFTHGQIPLESDGTNVYFNRDKIGFVGPDMFGWPEVNIPRGTNHFCLQGWAGELPSAFTLTAKMKLQKADNNAFWGSIAFCTPKDFWSDNNYKNLSEGYHLLLRESGQLQLYKKDSTQQVNILGEVQTTSLTQGQTAELKIECTSSTIKITRIDTNNTISVADATYRNGYLHLGRRISGILFKDIYIS